MNRKMKQLSLSRETVRNLSDNEMRTAAGGISAVETGCHDCRTETCTQCSRTCKVQEG